MSWHPESDAYDAYHEGDHDYQFDVMAESYVDAFPELVSSLTCSNPARLRSSMVTYLVSKELDGEAQALECTPECDRAEVLRTVALLDYTLAQVIDSDLCEEEHDMNQSKEDHFWRE